MELTKDNLFAEIQKYIYAHNFSDLKVFSKQYFHSIVLPCYQDNSKTEPYSIISIDFNDMQKINEKGMKRGDKILHDSVELMDSVMPDNSYCLRIGGDEFVFVLPNISQDKALEYEKAMHKQLHLHSQKIRNTTVTSYCIDSSASNNISSLIDIADSAINVIKQTAKDNSNLNKSIDKWDILENKINENMSTFFKNLRFHNFPMGPEHIRKILESVINSSDSFLPHNNESVTNNLPKDEPTISYINLMKEDLHDLNNLFIENRFKSPKLDDLKYFNDSTFAILLDSLVRDPLTMQFNKSYLYQSLLAERHKTLNVLRISAAFVKVSNTLNDSHSTTDKQIEKLGKTIYGFLSNKIHFNQDAFSDFPPNYMIALDGGDMVLALDSKSEIKAENIKEFLKTKNSENYSNENLLRLVCADSFQKVNKHTFDKILLKQSEECNNNKIPLINELLNDDIINDLLNVTLRDTMNFYKELVPDSNDLASRKKYINLVGKSILSLYSNLDVVHDETIKPQHKSNGMFSKISSKISSFFKPKYSALPYPIDSIHTVDSVSNTKTDFVEKVEVNHNKAIRNKNDLINKDQNKDNFSR